jgi:cbb3-type cytochrome oxidase subunit 3
MSGMLEKIQMNTVAKEKPVDPSHDQQKMQFWILIVLVIILIIVIAVVFFQLRKKQNTPDAVSQLPTYQARAAQKVPDMH